MPAVFNRSFDLPESLLTVLQFLLTSNLVKKRQRVIVVAIANAIAEQQVIVVAIASPIAHSKGCTQNPISKDAEG